MEIIKMLLSYKNLDKSIFILLILPASITVYLLDFFSVFFQYHSSLQFEGRR